MNNVLSNRVLSIKPSPSVQANALVSKLRAEGKNIVNMTVGEPDFNTPVHIANAAVEAILSGDTHYTPTPGTPALLQAIAEKLERDNNLSYQKDEIVAGCGGKHIISHALAATLNPGDEVIVHAPYWVSYPDLVVLNEATPVVVTTNESTSYKLTPEILEPAITKNTKWVILNYPNNPTGTVYEPEELRALADVLLKHPQVLIMADEIYEHFVYGEAKHTSLINVAPELKERTLIVNGASKGYAMTGWRLGFGAGPKFLISAISKLLSQTTTCPTSVSQAAAVAAFTGTQEPVMAMREAYEKRRALILSELSSVTGISYIEPKGAFYVYVNVGQLLNKTTPSGAIIASDADFVSYLLTEVGVGTVGGAAYGLSPYIRLSFASSEEEIIEGCKRLREACDLLR